MRFGVVLAVILGGLCYSAGAHAEACLDLLAKPTDAAACIERSTKEAEGELQKQMTTVTAQIGKIGPKQTRRRMATEVRTAQVRWQAFADAQCRLEAEAAKGKDDAAYAGSLCRRRLIDDRIQMLASLSKKLR